MKISVITPVYNSHKTITANVSSVLMQDYAEFEHIIIDNLSDDDSIIIVSQLYARNGSLDKLKIISEKDEGIADAFNKGLKAASGDITVILNSDDEFYSENLFNDVAKRFKENKDLLIIHGDLFFEDEKYGSNIRKPLNSKVGGIHFNHPGMFIKKILYEQIGYYNKDFKVSMDFELYTRIYNNYKLNDIALYMNDYPFVKMRAGGASWKNEFTSIKEIKKALKLNNLWDFNAKSFYYQRLLRTFLKNILSKIGLHKTVKLWRNYKWENNES